MPTRKRKPSKLDNKVYASVKLLSTTIAIDNAVESVQKTIQTLSSSSQDTKSIIRSIQNDLHTISGCNTILESEIAPSLTCKTVSDYCHKRIKSSGPDHLCHVDSAILITPEKRSVPLRNKPKYNHTIKPSGTTSCYKLIPLPINGHRFTPIEAMNWLVKVVRDTTINGKIKTMIRLKYVPIGKSRLYTMYKEFLQSDICPDEWHIQGRKPIITMQALNDCIEVHHQSNGRAVTGTDIHHILIQSRTNEAIPQGAAVSQLQPIHRNTIRNYRMLTAVNKNKCIVTKVQQKTENRYIAENSILSTICYLFTVACAHLLIGTPDPKFNNLRENKLTKGAQILKKLVSEANNNAPIYNVLPGLITSTDDTTVFVFKGATKELEGWYLLDKKHIASKQSSYSNDKGGTDNKNGLRVRLTFTINGVGMMAAPFVTVTGITEKELPRATCPSGVYILSIPGLCAGGNTDPRNAAMGYVAFIRTEKGEVSGKTSEQRNFEWYRENVLLPFIKNVRSRLYQHDDNTFIPDELSAVCWCDGANTQLLAITNEKQQIEDALNKIITCKHSAARTSVEQACDCCPIFRTIKSISKNITREDSPHLGLQRIVSLEFRRLENEGILKLASKKLSSLVDFLSCYPTILSKAAPHDAATAGFIDNGMIDSQSYSYPDLHSIIKTCKTIKFSNEMIRCVSSNFTAIYEEQVKTGHLHDDFMEGYGFKVDRNYVGEIIKRASTCEAWQRAKCLSSKYQRELRTRKINVFHLSKSVKLAETQQHLNSMHTQNKKCITQLLSVVSNEVMPRPHERIPDISAFVMENFAECKKDLLHGFIYVREFSNWKSNTTNGFKWPKKRRILLLRIKVATIILD